MVELELGAAHKRPEHITENLSARRSAIKRSGFGRGLRGARAFNRIPGGRYRC